MIEQYLCANSDLAGIGENGLPLNAGFGCVAKTQNLSDGDVSRLDVFARLFPNKRVSSEGCIITKFTVGKSGNFAVGMLRHAANGHLSHQFVFTGDSRAELVSSPEEFFRLPFISFYDTNKNYDLSSASTLKLTNAFSDILSFKDVISAFQLNETMFCKIIKAAFDCRKNNRKIIFVSDKTFQTEPKLIASLLYYIFKFLPYQLRMSLGFDTAYSQITAQNQINISFALPSEVSVSGDGVCVVGKRECKNDYIVYKGRILHGVDDGDSVDAGVYLISGISEYISAELSGTDCTEKLAVLFDNLYDYESGIPAGYLSDILTYDAIFAAMDIASGGASSRAGADALIRFYVSARKRIKHGEGFWDDAVSCFIKMSAGMEADNWLLSALSALYCQDSPVSAEASVQLKIRANQMFSRDNGKAVKEFAELVSAYDPEGACGLACLLFTADKQISLYYIQQRLSVGKTAFELCDATAELCRILGDEFYQTICDRTVNVLHSTAVTGADIDLIRRLSMAESSMDIRSVINAAAEEAMESVDYSELLPSWFRQQNWSFDFLPARAGAVSVFLVRDMINETVTTLPGQFFANYAYVDDDIFNKSLAAASNTVIRMLISHSLPLSVSTYAALHSAVYHDGSYDFDLLCDVLEQYPQEIPAFTAYFGSITHADGIDGKAKVSRFSKYLKRLEQTVPEVLTSLNVCELIASVNRTVKLGINSRYAKTFNAHLYSAFVKSKRGAVKAYYAVTRPFHILSSRSIKNRELITVCSVTAAVIVLALILSLIIFNGGSTAKLPPAEIYFVDSALEVTELRTTDIEDKKLIDTVDGVPCTDLSGKFTVKAPENAVRAVVRQQYMYSPDSTVLTSGGTADVTLDGKDYVFSLNTSGGYVYRVIITVTLYSDDGAETSCAASVINNNYRGSDE